MTVFNKLLELQKKAYCSYSNYPVACVIVDLNNNIYEGINIENASYGLTMCAERVAIGNWKVNSNCKIKEINLLCGNNQKTFGVPCGSCRQVINEFVDDEVDIILWNHEGKNLKTKISKILPGAFNKEFFEKE